MENKYVKIKTAGTDVALKVMPGHYATNHAHINYYIDMTTMKTRTSEAQELAKDLVSMYLYDTVIDIDVCMEETGSDRSVSFGRADTGRISFDECS